MIVHIDGEAAGVELVAHVYKPPCVRAKAMEQHEDWCGGVRGMPVSIEQLDAVVELERAGAVGATKGGLGHSPVADVLLPVCDGGRHRRLRSARRQSASTLIRGPATRRCPAPLLCGTF